MCTRGTYYGENLVWFDAPGDRIEDDVVVVCRRGRSWEETAMPMFARVDRLIE